MMRNNPFKTLGYILLAVLGVAAVILGVRVAGLVNRTYEQMSLTPTPVPPYGNVLQVTVDPSLPTPGPVLRSGSEGEAVWALQERLRELGYYTTAVDGQFGPGTRAAVTLFQQQHDLDADGIVGEETRTVLFSDQAHRVIVTPTPEPLNLTVSASLAKDKAGRTADGMPLLVNRTNYLPDQYRPVDLVSMNDYCDSSIVIIKEKDTLAEREAVDALMAMLRYAHNEGLTIWQVSAAYRSIDDQQAIFDEYVQDFLDQGFSRANAESATRQTVADPGSSEHHLGMAFDITVPGYLFVDTKQAAWLAEHCWEWGFILRYTKEKEAITGYLAEPWHIRYVGTEHSIRMRDENLCLEEYISRYGQH